MRGPIPNSYALLGGRLIAGEYPGHHESVAAREKLRALLDAGVTTFVDLTEPHELEPYEMLLAEEAATRGAVVSYVRRPIRDVSVPRSPRVMREILDIIDSALEAGGTVYVHCWGGVGRTGTVVGCHLARGGMTGDEALARVAELFRSMEKYPRRLRSPETDEQAEYVRAWREIDSVPDAEGRRRRDG